MPEDKTRLRMQDGRARGKVLEDEVVQGGRVSGRNVQQVVRPSGDVEHLDNARQVGGECDEGLDLVAVMSLQSDGDDGLYGQADSGQVDVGVIAADDAALAQGTDPPKAGGGRDPPVSYTHLTLPTNREV